MEAKKVKTQTQATSLDWKKIFPSGVTEDYLSSVTFIKQLTIIAISSIVHVRNAFSEDSYATENFGGLKVKVLKKTCRDGIAQFLSTALSRAFDAFDKKYLHQLAVCFYKEECNVENLLEYYIFEYSYKGDGVTLSMRSNSQTDSLTAEYTFDEVRGATASLIRACMVLSQFSTENLPLSYDLGVRLYYNEDAPEGYQTPGFHSSDTEDHLESTLKATTKLGRVTTPFHSMTTRFYKEDVVRNSYEGIPPQNTSTMTQSQERDSAGSGEMMVRSEFRLPCPCNNHESADINNAVLLTCQYCNTQQHAVCFGVLPDVAPRVRKHCCVTCYDENPTRTPTDLKLATIINIKRRQTLAMFRRTLFYCLQLHEVSALTIIERLGMNKINACKMIDTLQLLDIIEKVNPGYMIPRKINKEKLKKIIGDYFIRIENEETSGIVDRLLTYAEQEAHNDENDSVASERVHLKNSSVVGNENPNKSNKQNGGNRILCHEDFDEEIPFKRPRNSVKNDSQIKKKQVKRKVDAEQEKTRSSAKAKNAKVKKV